MDRCGWATNERLITYHDSEWGVPLHDDRKHFEFLILDGVQAGLSWDLVLRRRDGYRSRLRRLRPGQGRPLRAAEDRAVARGRTDHPQPPEGQHGHPQRAGVPEGAGRVRHVRCVHLAVRGRPDDRQRLAQPAEVPCRTAVSDAMSKDLRQRGFTFVGSTICYAYMQAAGLVNDHLVTVSGMSRSHEAEDVAGRGVAPYDRGMPYLIDGNNLMPALADAGPEVGREGLCRLLLPLLERGEAAHVVFDGPVPPAGVAAQIEQTGVKVTWSIDRKADEIILKWIAQDTAPKLLTVVSTDKEIRRAASDAAARSSPARSSRRSCCTSTPPAASPASPSRPSLAPSRRACPSRRPAAGSRSSGSRTKRSRPAPGR